MEQVPEPCPNVIEHNTTATAQHPLTLDELLNIQRVTVRVPLHLSPDGRWLSVSAQRQLGANEVASDDDGFTPQGVPGEALGSRVLVVETATGEVTEPFPCGGTSWAGQWSPDSQALVAYVQHEGYACLGVWEVESRTARMCREAEVHPVFGFEVPQWTPDGSTIVVKLRHHTVLPSAPRKQRKATMPVAVQSFAPAVAADPHATIETELATMLGDLASVDMQTGAVCRLVEGWQFRGWRVAPDGHAVALLRAFDVNLLATQTWFDLVVVPLNGGEPRVVAAHIPMWWGTSLSWSPDSKGLAYTTYDREQPAHLFVVVADGSQEPRRLSAEAGIQADEYNGPYWSQDGRFIYCSRGNKIWEFARAGSQSRHITAEVKKAKDAWGEARDEAKQQHVFRVLQRPLTSLCTVYAKDSLLCLVRDSDSKREGLGRLNLDNGQTEVLLEWEQITVDGGFSFAAAADGTACYLVRESSCCPPEVWRVREDTRGRLCQAQRLLSLNPALDAVALAETQIIEWRDAEGQVRRGVLATPANYQPGEHLPLLLSVYGDFRYTDQYVHRFGIDDLPYTNAHWLTGQGYAVLYPDMPMRANHPMRQMPGLALPAINRVIEMGVADSERVGVMGFSYGGYTVLSLLVQTTRFKAALSDGGAGFNMTSQYGLEPSWCEGDQGRMNGTLWEQRQAYIENSPLFYMDRVQTPLLLISGSEDEANAAQAQEVFNALRRLGQRVELRLYTDEGHGVTGWAESNIRDVCERVRAWFDEFLK